MDIQMLGLASAALTTAAYVPQVMQTFRSGTARDLNLPMLLLFTTGIVGWLVYGLALDNLPMILANSITVVLSSSLLVFKLREMMRQGRV